MQTPTKNICYQSIFLLLFLILSVPAQAALPAGIDTLQVSTGFLFSKQTLPPFWAYANNNGRVSTERASSMFTRLRINKHADDEKTFDWYYGVDVTARTNSSQDLIWTDAYAALAYKNLRLTLGRKAETFGLVDTLLSAGSTVYSRNAPTIPKVSLATNGYVDLTDWLAVNVYLAHGWLGEERTIPNSLLHEKFVYLRLGESYPDQGLNFYAGVHDLAVWGGDGQPSGLKDLLNVFLGKGGSNGAITEQQNALGDHRGTIEFALQQKESDRDFFLYVQTMFEDGSGLRFWYPGDYLLGVSMINKNKESHFARINLELLDTRSGAIITDYPDDYLTNGYYGAWVYKGFGIGTPFIPFVKGADNSYSPLNRVRVINTGVLLRFTKLVNPLVRVAYIENYGSIGNPLPDNQKTSMVACDLTNTTPIAHGWSLTQQLSLDAGKSISPNPAFGLTITKTIE